MKEQNTNSFVFASPQSIDDDDLCATCKHCNYKPGEESTCELKATCQVSTDLYVVTCDQFDQGLPGHHIRKDIGEQSSFTAST